MVAVARRPQRRARTPRPRARAVNSERSKPAREHVARAGDHDRLDRDSSAASSSSASLISSRSAIESAFFFVGPIQRERRRAVARSTWRSVTGSRRVRRSAVAVGALEEPGALDDDARDAARGDEPARVAHRDAEREPAALDRLERRFGRHRAADRRGREVRRAGPGSRRSSRSAGRSSATASTVASSASATTRGVPSTGTSPLCNASDVSASATSSVTDPTRPGFTPMDVR